MSVNAALTALLSFVMLCLVSQAQVAVISGQAVDQYGQPMPSAQIRVCSVTSTGNPCTPTASLYYDYQLTQSAPNPVQADQYGNYLYYAPALAEPNLYEVQVSPVAGVTWNYVIPGPDTLINFLAPPQNWPSWLVPSLANSTTTPTLSVSASPIPNSALQNSSVTINQVTAPLGSSITVPGGVPLAYSGNDYGPVVCATAAANPGATLVFVTPGNIASACDLSAYTGVSLRFAANVSFSAPLTLPSNSTVSCAGEGVLLTSTMVPGSDILILPSGTSNFTLSHCRAEGNYNYFVFNPTGYTQDVTLDTNEIHNGGMYDQQSALASSPTLRFRSLHNTCTFDSPTAGIICEVLYGANHDFLTDGDTCTGSAHCHEFYAIDGGSFPSYSTVAAAGLNNGIMAHTTCRNVYYACDWTSGADYVSISGGQANGCGDVCFDHEAGGHTYINGGWKCTSSGAGCATVFFVSTAASITEGSCSGTAVCVGLHNAQQSSLQNLENVLVNGITFDCGGSTTYCTFISLDSNTGTSVTNSQVTNGLIASPGYSAGLNFNNDVFTFNVPIPGLSFPNLRNGALNVFKNITIQSLVTQAAGTSAIGAVNIDYNYQNTYIFDALTTLGFPSDVYIANQGGNVPANFTIRNSTLGAGTVTFGTSNAGVAAICTNDYPLAGTSPLPTACH